MESLIIVALLLSLFLLFKVMSLQNQLRDIKTELEWMKHRSNCSGMSSSTTSSKSLPDLYDVDTDLEERLRFLMASNEKIKAIKTLREARNISLKDAKDYVERLEQNN